MINARPKWIDHLFLQNVLDGDVAYLPQAAANEKLGYFSSSPVSNSSPEGADGGGGEGAFLLDPRGEDWARRYFMPANADAAVVAWRRWLHGGRGRSGWLDVISRAAGNNGTKGSGSGAGIGSARVVDVGRGSRSFPALSSSSSAVVGTAAGAATSAASSAVPLPRSDLPRSELFDRWNQHTKNCPSCAGAMRGAQRARAGLGAAAVVCGVFASASALLLLLLSASTASSSSSATGAEAAVSSAASFDARTLLGVLLSSSALSGLSLAGSKTAATLESWFVFKDYEHWKS